MEGEKHIPVNIREMYSEISLARPYRLAPLALWRLVLGRWVLGPWFRDGVYFDSYGKTNTFLLCTELFTKEECLTLQGLRQSTRKVNPLSHVFSTPH